MSRSPRSAPPDGRHERLEHLRRSAARETSPAPPGGAEGTEYARRSFLKAPVWTWEVPLYFFVGGLAGMAAVIAVAAAVAGRGLIARDALVLATTGAVLSAPLLILDLGRPGRFLHMLRIFKWRSPMSIGAWTLVLFSTTTSLSLAAILLHPALLADTTRGEPLWILWMLLLALTAILGAILATYTGVLLGATAVPVWARHARTLPIHFGAAGLGSAAAALRLHGHGGPVDTLLLVAIGVEAILWLGLLRSVVGLERRIRKDPARVVDRVLARGRGAALLLSSAIAIGPLALGLLLLGLPIAAALVFLAGALGSRFGWLAVGRASARDGDAAYAVSTAVSTAAASQ